MLQKDFSHILEFFQCRLRSHLLRTLFTAAGANANHLTVQTYFHIKTFIMVRTGLPYLPVAEGLVFLLLYQFLQCGLVIGIVHLLNGNLYQNEFLDKSSCCLHAAI